MEDERHVLPAARLICESYVTFCKTKPWVEAVAASLTELFAPKIHQQRIEAFPKHYSWIPPEGLDYFRSRLIQAPRDVTHGLVDRADALHHGGDAAAGLRGPGLQAGHALGADRHDPQRLPGGVAVAVSADAVPKLWKLARLDFDPVRGRPVLLYPEGAVLLNDTGNAILELVDGRRTIGEIAGLLGERYQADVTADVVEYLTHLAERELIRDI